MDTVPEGFVGDTGDTVPEDCVRSLSEGFVWGYYTRGLCKKPE